MAELYASRTLRTFALSMVSVFIAVYLYKSGYSLSLVMLFFAFYYVVRIIVSYPFAHLVAWVGPKRGTLLSNLLYVPALLLLALIPQYDGIALVVGGIFQALSVTLYDISYMTGFSKIKSDEHSGKELGYMHMLELVARGVSPVLGGMIAFAFGPQVTLVTASIVFTLAAMPLFFSPEPVRTRQSITFRGIPWRTIRPDMISELGVGTDYVTTGIVWSLFLTVIIFPSVDNAIYAELGVLSSITLLVGIGAARVFGVIIDSRKGGDLLKVGIIANSCTHIARIFAATPFGVVMVNIFNELATTAYFMPYMKGVFARADELPGYRIPYVSLMSAATATGSAILCLVLAGIMYLASEEVSLKISFAVGAITVLAIWGHNFAVLKRSLFRNSVY